MRAVGLTGGIATGKSTVSALLETYQVPVVDCDKIAKSVVQKVRHGLHECDTRLAPASPVACLLAKGV